ncbi:MAG: response regulator [Saprospiraceae bacterium]|nr:response regulator [Saprospiraceae bacterium]
MDKRIVIFDDNIKRRKSRNVNRTHRRDDLCVGSFQDCSNVLKNIDPKAADLVLMDIDMPSVNGIEGVTTYSLQNSQP